MGSDFCRACRIRIGRDIRLAEIVAVFLQILIGKFLVNIVCRILLVRLKGQLGRGTISRKYGASRVVRIALTVDLIAHRLQRLQEGAAVIRSQRIGRTVHALGTDIGQDFLHIG